MYIMCFYRLHKLMSAHFCINLHNLAWIFPHNVHVNDNRMLSQITLPCCYPPSCLSLLFVLLLDLSIQLRADLTDALLGLDEARAYVVESLRAVGVQGTNFEQSGIAWLKLLPQVGPIRGVGGGGSPKGKISRQYICGWNFFQKVKYCMTCYEKRGRLYAFSSHTIAVHTWQHRISCAGGVCVAIEMLLIPWQRGVVGYY